MAEGQETALDLLKGVGLNDITPVELDEFKRSPQFKNLAMTVALLFAGKFDKLEAETAELREQNRKLQEEITNRKKVEKRKDDKKYQATVLLYGIEEKSREKLDDVYGAVVKMEPSLTEVEFYPERMGGPTATKPRPIRIEMFPSYKNIKKARELVADGNEIRDNIKKKKKKGEVVDDKVPRFGRYMTQTQRHINDLFWKMFAPWKEKELDLAINFTNGGEVAITNRQKSFYYDFERDIIVEHEPGDVKKFYPRNTNNIGKRGA